MTREQAKVAGLECQSDVEVATEFKLQDVVLLNDCISSAAICSSSRSATSKLQLFQKNNEREGLSESLFLKCTACDTVTPLSTSNRLGGKGWWFPRGESSSCIIIILVWTCRIEKFLCRNELASSTCQKCLKLNT